MNFNLSKKKDTSSSTNAPNLYCPGIPDNSVPIQESSSSDCSHNHKNDKTNTIKHQRVSSENENDLRKKRMQAVRERFQEIEDQSARDIQEIRKNPVIRRTSVQDQAEYNQLKKQFQAYKYLPLLALRQVKHDIEKYTRQYKTQSANPEESLISKIRFQQKKKLFRSVRLAVEEIRFKIQQQERDQFQKHLLGDTVDLIDYSEYIASRIEKVFFKHLYHIATEKKKGDIYIKQIRVVLKEFSDKNNLEFRRKVLNPKFDYKSLTTVTEEELKCQKTKDEEAERVRQLIRENQKIEQKVVEVEEEFECPTLNTFNSVSDLYKGSKENNQKKELQRGLQKTKQICKKAYSKIVKSVKNMSLRVAEFKSRLPTSVFLDAIEQMN